MTALVFAALVWKFTDFARMVANFRTQRSAIFTQLFAWVVGVLGAFVGAEAEATEGLVLPGMTMPLGNLDALSCVLVGLLIASLASAGVDVKQAVDSSDSAAKPRFF